MHAAEKSRPRFRQSAHRAFATPLNVSMIRTLPFFATNVYSVVGEAITTAVPAVLKVRDPWVRSPPQTLPEKRTELPGVSICGPFDTSLRRCLRTEPGSCQAPQSMYRQLRS